MILHEKNKVDFDKSKTHDMIWCACDYCNSEFTRSKRNIKLGWKVIKKESCSNKKCTQQKREESQMLLYGVKNAGGTEESKIKSKETSLKKYGVESPNQLESVKQKIKKTCLEKYGKESYFQTEESRESLKKFLFDNYGVENPGQVNEYKEKSKKTCKELYGFEFHSQTQNHKDQVRNTCLEKYGVESVLQSKEIQQKIIQTNLDRHGVEFPIQSKVIQEKLKNTNLQKYGFSCARKSEEINSKIKETNLKKYGHTSPTKNSLVQQKIKNTCFARYGKTSFLGTDICKQKTKEWSLKNYNVEYYSQSKEFKEKSKTSSIKKYGVNYYSMTDVFKEQVKSTCFSKYGVGCPLSLQKFRKYGKTQNEIREWLLTFGYEFKNNFKILNGKEIDLYNEELKLGIEYCGLYWHNEMSPSPRMRNYHYNKFKICKENGIHLITIFEDEWINKKDQCKNFIEGSLGSFKQKIYARKCNVVEIDLKTSNDFLNKNHVLGSNKKSKVQFGIFYNNELCGVMTLGRHHRKNEPNVIVLDRMCFSSGLQITGGASKLFSACKNWSKANGFDSIISWSDNRWSFGNVYSKIGFILEADLPPDYSYVNLNNSNVIRLTKQSQKKSNTNCPKDKTEYLWAKERGFARIWDCGKKRWKIII